MLSCAALTSDISNSMNCLKRGKLDLLARMVAHYVPHKEESRRDNKCRVEVATCTDGTRSAILHVHKQR